MHVLGKKHVLDNSMGIPWKVGEVSGGSGGVAGTFGGIFWKEMKGRGKGRKNWVEGTRAVLVK